MKRKRPGKSIVYLLLCIKGAILFSKRRQKEKVLKNKIGALAVSVVAACLFKLSAAFLDKRLLSAVHSTSAGGV